jgi:DNA invertase Pin-like site-specific DNA recombinase
MPNHDPLAPRGPSRRSPAAPVGAAKRQLTIAVRRWTPEPLTPSERRAAARQLVTALSGSPQPAANAPATLRHNAAGGEAMVLEPLSYVELDATFSPVEWEAQRHCQPFDLATRKRKISEHAQLTAMNASMPPAPAKNPPKARQVVGRGGRQPRHQLGLHAAPLDGLIEALGEPRRIAGPRAEILVFEVNPLGRGAILARLSSEESADGDKLLSQIADCDALLRRAGRHSDGELLTARYVIASANNSAAQPYRDRLDLRFIEDRIYAHELDWIVARHPDRLVREDHARATLFKLLQETQTALYLAALGRAVDWRNDKMSLQAMGMADERERELIYERTTRGHHAQVLAGRGWGTSPRFGFYRSPVDKHWHQDDEQWLHIRWLFERYKEICQTKTKSSRRAGGTRQLSEELEERGLTLSPTYLRQMLRDPLYVTGERPPVRVKGHLVACQPVKLKDPISAELFAAVGELLDAQNGPNSKTPIGTHPFNRIAVLHARCMGTSDKPTMLRARQHGNLPSRLYHGLPVPGCCAGEGKTLTIDEQLFTAAVVAELRRLAGCAELRREWEQRRRNQATPDEGAARREQLKREKTKLAELIARRDGATTKYARDVAEGGGDEDLVMQILRGVMTEIKRQTRIIEVEEAALKNLRSARHAIEEQVEDDDEADLLRAIREVLTIELPEDLELRRRRAAVIEACLSKIIVHDAGEGVELELFGPLAPEGAAPVGPLAAAEPILRALSLPTQAQQEEAVHAAERVDQLELDAVVGLGAVQLGSRTAHSSEQECAVREFLLDPSRWRTRRAERHVATRLPSWMRRIRLTRAKPPADGAGLAARDARIARRRASSAPDDVAWRAVDGEHRREAARRVIARDGRSGRPLFGFRPDPQNRSRLLVDEEQWRIVEWIFDEFDRGSSANELHRRLLANGRRLSAVLILRILSSSVYVDGIYRVYVHDELVYERQVRLARAIPADLFERAQARKRGRSRSRLVS